MNILLGISGGIAAYKTAELVRLYQQRGHRVQVVLTRAGRRFISPLTLATLSRQPVLEALFPRRPAAGEAPGREPGADLEAAPIEHIAVAQAADVVVVAPATAHVLARMALGLADDLLTTILLATPAPVVVAPAMNVQMWQHAATQAHLQTLRQRGVTVVDPAAGYLACGMVGEGRMAAGEAIVAATEAAAHPPRQDLEGERVLITAGPTREAIDPVRYLSNRSSGRMGYALAEAAQRRGAQVELISGPTALPVPAGVELVAVLSAEQMAAAAEAGFERCSIAILAAAVADYRPLLASQEKLKKGAPRLALELVATPDILARLGQRKRRQRLIGFAAETDTAQALAAARGKRQAKNADLIVYNDVSRSDIGFDVADNEVTLITAQGEQPLAKATKAAIADQILDAIVALPRVASPGTHQHALPHA